MTFGCLQHGRIQGLFIAACFFFKGIVQENATAAPATMRPSWFPQPMIPPMNWGQNMRSYNIICTAGCVYSYLYPNYWGYPSGGYGYGYGYRYPYYRPYRRYNPWMWGYYWS